MHEKPWWLRTPVLFAVMLAVIALVAGSGVMLFGSNDAQQGDSGNDATSGNAAGESSSACDLPDGPDSVPTGAPDGTRWIIAPNGVSTPEVEEYGPAETTEEGYHFCFARNPIGAVLSVAWFTVDTENPNIDREKFAADRVAGLVGQARFAAETPPQVTGAFEFRGFRFPTEPSRDAATVEILLYIPDAGELRSVAVDVVWETSDWRIVYPDEPLEVARHADASGFIPWQDSAEASAQGELGRAAPGWSTNQAPVLGADDEDLTPDPPYTDRERKWAEGFYSGLREKEFAGMSHAERKSQMTPKPALRPAERAWLRDPPKKTAYFFHLRKDGSLSSDGRALFFRSSHAGRSNMMKGLTPEGEEPGIPGKKLAGSDVADCAKLNIGSCGSLVKKKGKDLVSDVAGDLANSAFGRIAESAVDAAEWGMKELMTSWLKYPDPAVSKCYGGSTSCGSGSVAAWTQAHLHWLVVFAMTAAIMIGAIRMMLTGRGEHARDLGFALVKTVVVTFGAGTIIVTGLQAGDIYSEWILEESDFELKGSLFGAGVMFGGLTNPFLLLILAGLVLLVQVIQFGLMVVRGAMVILLAGFLPLASSMSNTAVGRQWLSKSVQWLAAWIVYKPLAATIYAVAIQMTLPDQGVATQLSGIFLMVLAILALPALMRFVVPWVASAAGGNAGAVAMGVAGGMVATGALVATGGAAGALGGGFAGTTATGGRPGSGGGGSDPRSGITAPPSGSGDPGPSAAPGANATDGPDVVETSDGGERAGSSSGSPRKGSDSPGGSGSQPAGQSSSAPQTTSGGPAPAPAGGTAAGGASGAPASMPAGSVTTTGQSPPPTGRGNESRGSTPAAAAQIAHTTTTAVDEKTSGAVESERHA